MRVLLAVATLVVIAGVDSISLEDQEFENWKVKFGKSYGSEEEESQRRMIWLDNLKLVLEHNLLADQGIKSYRLGMNHFADMDNQEYQEMLKGCLGFFNESEIQNTTFLEPVRGAALPNTVNWKKRGYVTKVKDQSHCGSCWAFSALNRTLKGQEGQMFKKTKRLVSLSEQQLVDCSQSYGNHGCQGGWPHRAFEYIKYKDLEKTNTYPYLARINAEFLRITTVPLEAKFFASFDKHSSKLLELIRKKAGVVKERTASILQILDETVDINIRRECILKALMIYLGEPVQHLIRESQEGRCKFNSRRAWARCSRYRSVHPSEKALKYAVAKVGPISVGIDARHHSFQLYRSGVYDEPACGTTLNHAVLVVGYGTHRRRKDYWLVKNSWGTRWGNRGYIKMSRNKGNQCGIVKYDFYPVV